MNQLKVKIWGEELGRLIWDPKLKTTYFTFNPHLKERPDVAPLLAPSGNFNNGLPVWANEKRIYQKLPSFISDSLPDSWGNKLFDRWVKVNRIPKNQITPLYKLMFIGKRGMGAFEYEPAANELNYKGDINIQSLYDLSLKVFDEREESIICPDDNISMETLIAVGTSAGGRQMKAIIAINHKTGEIRSGQVENPEDFIYYILKFEDSIIPTTEIELTYYEMALRAGIQMVECSSLEVEGVSHFLTKRFDRKGNEKIHMQTLAAISPEADSYEDLISVARQLNLSEKEIAEIFRRLVFNVIGNNTDDHNKNFSFLLEKGGIWKLSPAYDMTFIFNRSAKSGEIERCRSLYGKISDITKEDLLEFAQENNIRNPQGIIDKIIDVFKLFPILAEKNKIPDRIISIINASIANNLMNGGFLKNDNKACIYVINGKEIVIDYITLNIKGLYEICMIVNGNRNRKFVDKKEDLYKQIQKYQMGMMSEVEIKGLLMKLI